MPSLAWIVVTVQKGTHRQCYSFCEPRQCLSGQISATIVGVFVQEQSIFRGSLVRLVHAFQRSRSQEMDDRVSVPRRQPMQLMRCRKYLVIFPLQELCFGKIADSLGIGWRQRHRPAEKLLRIIICTVFQADLPQVDVSRFSSQSGQPPSSSGIR